MGEPDHDRRRATARAVVISAATAGIGALGFALAPLDGRAGPFGAAAAIAGLGLLAPLSIHRARVIAGSDRPIADAVVTITALLTLLVFGFAAVYVVLADRGGQIAGVETRLDAVYFTVTTLATVGFGDIHATGQAARLVVTVQMLVDLGFLAVAVRLLAGVARHRVAARGSGRVVG